ncbi:MULTISPECIES: glycosyltransferase family 2 protein [unclassified Rhizobium]|uniref:glycosyltransferase family 2 protein n=1 Tax=unclassified Rhizobium TaxID=2613769 RepID=UPI0006FC5A05|nr:MULTISPECIES: glycosyltransferase family 2 protein [unclassified Rhizobium]KQV33337.1 glycosyl transferase [Rhizobium sp. Root1212]KRD22471.1 glycosyl transferase [Rhizobium sp. Root268]
MSVPDVSFIIAAYNSAKTIRRAVESALAQSDVTVEVIVIDDCSADETRDVVSAIADERVRLIPLARNRGPGGARNAGFDAARGRWLAILDADDEVEPQRLSRMIEKAANLNADIVVDNLDVIDGDGVRSSMFTVDALHAQPLLTLPAFIDSNRLFHATHNFGYLKPVFLRSFIETHGLRFDEKLRIGEDYILLASALASGGLCAIEPSAGYIYHIREGSISRVLRLDHVEAMIAGDARFTAAFTLDSEAQAAQTRRARSLVDAYDFLTLIEQMKARSLSGVLRTALANPRAVRHLRLPVKARFERMAAQFGRSSSTPGKAHNPSKG